MVDNRHPTLNIEQDSPSEGADEKLGMRHWIAALSDWQVSRVPAD